MRRTDVLSVCVDSAGPRLLSMPLEHAEFFQIFDTDVPMRVQVREVSYPVLVLGTIQPRSPTIQDTLHRTKHYSESVAYWSTVYLPKSTKLSPACWAKLRATPSNITPQSFHATLIITCVSRYLPTRLLALHDDHPSSHQSASSCLDEYYGFPAAKQGFGTFWPPHHLYHDVSVVSVAHPAMGKVVYSPSSTAATRRCGKKTAC